MLAIAFALSACGTHGSGQGSKQPSATGTTPHKVTPVGGNGATGAIPAGLAKYYHQKLHWRHCSSFRCSWLRVPLDYAHPSGPSIKIAVLDVVAADPSHRVGALVVNPGGPGGSGVQWAAGAAEDYRRPVLAHYDIVGFDPRGVGESDPLRCMGTKGLDHFLSADPDPDTTSERSQLDANTRHFGKACLQHSGAIARHMSTAEAAKDMDVLRAALGQKKLSYFGASYGTFLGATYANLFPHNVGRMVLDGALDPALGNLQLNLQQAHGFEVALRAYAAHCVSSGDCPAGNSVSAVIKTIQGLFARADKHPLRTDDPQRPLTEGLAMMGVWMPLYDKASWDQLSLALDQALHQHNGADLLQMADLYASRGPRGYEDNSMDALYDVNCLDHDGGVPVSKVPAYFKQFQKASPTFGRSFAYSLSTCHSWPIHTGQHSHPLPAKGAAPILVLGTTRDPATPLAWAKALAGQLDSGVLVTRNGDGHTAYNRGNACVDNTVDKFLVNGVVPKSGKAC